MAITQLENFSGVRAGVELATMAIQTGPGALGIPSAIPAVAAGAQWGAYQEPFALGIEKVGDKYWLGGGTGYGIANVFNQYALNIAALAPVSANTFTLGVRYKRKSATTSALNVPIFRTLRGVYWAIAVPVAISEWYLELVFNRTDKSIAAYIDGRFQWSNKVTDTNDLAELAANTLQIGLPISGVEKFYITDLYATADIGDDTPSGRLGPQDITDVPMQVVAHEGWDITNFADAQAWRDFVTDPVKYLIGAGQDPVLKLKPVDGYELPFQSNVNAIMLHSRAAHNQGNPADLQAKIVRGTHNDAVTLSMLPNVSLANPSIRLINGSRGNEEIAPATALNGLEVSLTVVAR